MRTNGWHLMKVTQNGYGGWSGRKVNRTATNAPHLRQEGYEY